jgi:hypothetical protein
MPGGGNVFYLQCHLYIGGKFGFLELMVQLHQLNACIPYFPRNAGTNGKADCHHLPDDELHIASH